MCTSCLPRNILLTPLPSHVLRLNLDLNRSLIFKMLSEKGHKLGATTSAIETFPSHFPAILVKKEGTFDLLDCSTIQNSRFPISLRCCWIFYKISGESWRSSCVSFLCPYFLSEFWECYWCSSVLRRGDFAHNRPKTSKLRCISTFLGLTFLSFASDSGQHFVFCN